MKSDNVIVLKSAHIRNFWFERKRKPGVKKSGEFGFPAADQQPRIMRLLQLRLTGSRWTLSGADRARITSKINPRISLSCLQ